jgi:hypothetical protein
MPQTTYLPVYTAEYPILAKAQKPGGVTVLSTVSGGDVPNKPTYAAGTIQSLEQTLAAEAEAAAHQNEGVTEEPEDNEVHEEEVEEDDGNGGTVKRKRTVTRSRTTTTHRRR